MRNLIERYRYVFISLIFLIAFFFRAYGINSIGISEDEARKIEAIEGYMKGDFTLNAEHPMLLKIVGLISIKAFNLFSNSTMVDSLYRGDIERDLRFPIILIGSLTCLAIFLLGRELFSNRVGIISSLLWGVGVSAISFNRIAKEDTLLVFFFILGSYFFVKGKKEEDKEKRNLIYYLGAACIGFMYASKYVIPYCLILLVYYDILHRRDRWYIENRVWIKIIIIAMVALIIINPIILSPKTLAHMKDYFLHKKIDHHGYYFMGELYENKAIYTLWGIPWYFYLVFLGVKVPLSILVAFALGLIFLIPQWKKEGALFILLWFFMWLALLSIPGGKFTRYILEVLPAFYLIAAVGIDRLIRITSKLHKNKALLIVVTIFVILLLVHPFYAAIKSKPYYRIYLNEFGRNRIGYFFPQDEFYGIGFREAIAYLSHQAEKESVVIVDGPTSCQYYLKRYKRNDLKLQRLAVEELELNSTKPYYIVLHYGKRYIENEYFFKLLPKEFTPIKVIKVKGKVVVQIFKISGKKDLEKLYPLTKIREQWKTRLVIES